MLVYDMVRALVASSSSRAVVAIELLQVALIFGPPRFAMKLFYPDREHSGEPKHQLY